MPDGLSGLMLVMNPRHLSFSIFHLSFSVISCFSWRYFVDRLGRWN